jgi:acyl dehydratase
MFQSITFKITIADKKDHKKPDFGAVSEWLEVLNQRSETVLAADHLLLVRK